MKNEDFIKKFQNDFMKDFSRLAKKYKVNSFYVNDCSSDSLIKIQTIQAFAKKNKEFVISFGFCSQEEKCPCCK